MFRKLFILLMAVSFSAGISGTVHAAEYVIDVSHSTIGFAVKHLQVSTTRGEFTGYEGTVTYNPDSLESFKADVTIQADTINTHNETRDNHLRSSDFIDVPNHPQITFTSSRLERRGEGMVVVGDLTLRGVTKTLTIPVSITGPVQSPFGSTVIGLQGQVTIDRQQFGISWNKSLDNGGYVVGNDVTLIVEIEAASK